METVQESGAAKKAAKKTTAKQAAAAKSPAISGLALAEARGDEVIPEPLQFTKPAVLDGDDFAGTLHGLVFAKLGCVAGAATAKKTSESDQDFETRKATLAKHQAEAREMLV